MAERDPQISKERPQAASAPQPGSPKKWLRPVLMVSFPLLLAGGGAAYYLANDHYVSTDNAYVQHNKVSVSAEVNGRIVEVAVRENQTVKAGDLLFRIDPKPYELAAAQADAAIASAQVRLNTLQTD